MNPLRAEIEQILTRRRGDTLVKPDPTITAALEELVKREVREARVKELLHTLQIFDHLYSRQDALSLIRSAVAEQCEAVTELNHEGGE